jgi:hypothetical protein
MVIPNDTLEPALLIAEHMNAGIEIEVLTVETFEEAQAAADRIEQAREAEREQTGSNRIEGIVADADFIYGKRDNHTPIIISGPSSGMLDAFWYSVEELKAARQQQADS